MMKLEYQELEAVAAILSRFPHFTIGYHVNPDGDCLGSSIALAMLLRKMGKSADILKCAPVPKRYQFLPFMNDMVEPGLVSDPGVLIAVDCGDEARLGGARSLIARASHFINIDHHASNPGYGTINWVDPRSAAVGEMIYLLAQHLGVALDSAMAESLYVSLATDTGSFRYDNTTAQTHTIVSHLLAHGVEVNAIAQRVFDSRSLAATQMIGKALGSLKMLSDGHVAAMTITLQEASASSTEEDETDGIINFGRNIDGVDVAVLFRELPDNLVKVGFRSSAAVDVGTLAKGFGGGGHPRAAGCTMQGSMDHVRQQVLAAIMQRFQGAV